MMVQLSPRLSDLFPEISEQAGKLGIRFQMVHPEAAASPPETIRGAGIKKFKNLSNHSLPSESL